MLSIVATNDGSDTILNSVLNSTYHSINGAMQESMHVFIKEGFNKLNNKTGSVSILEIGYGTGLNAWLTYLEVLKNPSIDVEYLALEPFPIENELIQQLNFPLIFNNSNEGISFNQFQIEQMHGTLNNRFKLKIVKEKWEHFNTINLFDLIYYDAFSPGVQPDMWSSFAMKKVSKSLKTDGIWVTYCAKGEVRRNLIFNGLRLEKIEGPPGKRHMLRATKSS